MFWVDETVDEILDRQAKRYLITDYKTPSGRIHIGSLRGVLIHDVIRRGLSDNNQAAEFWYGFDDFDPMDGLPKELEKDYAQYMGQPLCNIPSPNPKKTFAQYFAEPFINIFQSLGVSAKIIWGSEIYRSGQYDKAIEIVLDNASVIRKIYKDVSGGEKPTDWYPLNVICPNCGKIGTTRVYDWDGKEVSFTCEPEMVKWAQGCGYKGTISPFKGNAKMPYKVETPSKWYTFGTSVELAGKDHFTKGGTFDIARAIAKEVFDIKPAYGYGYEWFLAGGKSMGTSKGIGVSAEEVADLLTPEILRFLMVRTRAKRTIDFDPYGDTIPLLFDEYDRCFEAFKADPKSDLGRAYNYSEVDINKSQPEYMMRFSKVAFLLQMPHVDVMAEAAKEKGAALTVADEKEITNRIEVAKKWLATYASDSAKFTLQEKLPESAQKLSPEQKQYLTEVATRLSKQEDWTGEAIHAILHAVKNDHNISPKDAFSALYRIFLDKDSGPQAGWFLSALDKKFVIKRLQEVKL